MDIKREQFESENKRERQREKHFLQLIQPEMLLGIGSELTAGSSVWLSYGVDVNPVT